MKVLCTCCKIVSIVCVILWVYCNLHMWPSTGKPGTTRHPSKKFFLLLQQSCRRPDIELSKFYRRSLSRSHYNRPNRSLPSAWNDTFLRNRSIFSRYLFTPRCARFSCRRSHILNGLYHSVQSDSGCTNHSNMSGLHILEEMCCFKVKASLWIQILEESGLLVTHEAFVLSMYMREKVIVALLSVSAVCAYPMARFNH